MEFIILANPAAGGLRSKKGRRFLEFIAAQLKCPVVGLDTRSCEELRTCAREASKACEVLLVAGGDGTFSEVMTCCESDVILGFLPFGSGNALKQALGITRKLKIYLNKVLRKEYSLASVILCNDITKAFQASVGMDGRVIQQQQLLARFIPGHFPAYMLAFVRVLSSFKRTTLNVWVDERYIQVFHNLTTIISRHPYYGYGLMINRSANLKDEYLHLRSINSTLLPTLTMVAAAFLNRQGRGIFCKGKRIRISCETEQAFQCDGEFMGQGKEFGFEVLPGSVKLII
jgi:diacylglycerol kinase family enzyme